MVISIKDPEADRLARRVAQLTGETITEAARNSLRERLAKKEAKKRDIEGLLEEVKTIVDRFVSRPVLDDRSADEILGYDERGLPT
jgi:antitoxin VapB